MNVKVVMLHCLCYNSQRRNLLGETKKMCTKQRKRKEETIPEWEMQRTDIDILRHIRKEPGRVYKDQLTQLFCPDWGSTSMGEDADSMDKQNPVDRCLEWARLLKWIVVDETNGIATIPSKRKEIDRLIGNRRPWEEQNRDEVHDWKMNWKANAATKGHAYSFGKFALNIDTMGISIVLDSGIIVNNFSLETIYMHFYDRIGKHTELAKRINELHFEKVQAIGVWFRGDTTLCVNKEGVHPWYTGQFEFNRSTFEKEIILHDMVYVEKTATKGKYQTDNKISFRDCEFLKGVRIRNLLIVNSSTEMEISFEDAFIKERFEICYSDIGHTRINCFQMVVGDYIFCPMPDREIHVKIGESEETYSAIEGNSEVEQTEKAEILLKNLFMYEDAIIDFSHVEMIDKGKIVIENIPVMPRMFLNFQKQVAGNGNKGNCPRLSLTVQNCALYGVLKICNIYQLSLKDFTNFGTIENVPEIEWGQMKRNKMLPWSSDKLVKSVQNQRRHEMAMLKNKKANEKRGEKRKIVYEASQSFIILKKNYEACGKNDSEDEALVQYMWHHHRTNPQACTKTSWIKESICWMLYRALYWTGMFGTSPLWTAISFLVVIFAFTIGFDIYFMIENGGAITLLWNLKKDAFNYSIACILPISYKTELGVELPKWAVFWGNIEHILGSILIWYFSIALVRKTMR